MNILVLDDEKDVCELFKSRLEMEGFLCMTASSIDEAWTKTRILRFDVIIIDLKLQGTTRGDQFGRDYKKRYPWARVIYVTGSENPVPPELVLTIIGTGAGPCAPVALGIVYCPPPAASRGSNASNTNSLFFIVRSH